MATNVYEGMFLLDSNRYARDPGTVSDQITQIVEKCGGEMLVSRLWSEQKLAYEIDGHRKGTYWMTYCRMDGQKQTDLTRACQLNENILRNLVIRIDDRLVDALVQHAVPETAAVPESETPAETTEGAGATEAAGAEAEAAGAEAEAAGAEAEASGDAGPAKSETTAEASNDSK